MRQGDDGTLIYIHMEHLSISPSKWHSSSLFRRGRSARKMTAKTASRPSSCRNLWAHGYLLCGFVSEYLANECKGFAFFCCCFFILKHLSGFREIVASLLLAVNVSNTGTWEYKDYWKFRPLLGQLYQANLSWMKISITLNLCLGWF